MCCFERKWSAMLACCIVMLLSSVLLRCGSFTPTKTCLLQVYRMASTVRVSKHSLQSTSYVSSPSEEKRSSLPLCDERLYINPTEKEIHAQ